MTQITIVEIETDRAQTEIEAEDSDTLAQLVISKRGDIAVEEAR